MPYGKKAEGCKSCSEIDGNIIYGGSIKANDEAYVYVIVESDKKAAGKHFIFTTVSHHVGAEMVSVRAALNAEVTKLASHLFGPNYRLINNSGKASSMDHYHCHIIVPEVGERLPRAVANVQKVIEELSAPPEVKAALDKALLQQK